MTSCKRFTVADQWVECKRELPQRQCVSARRQSPLFSLYVGDPPVQVALLITKPNVPSKQSRSEDMSSGLPRRVHYSYWPPHSFELKNPKWRFGFTGLAGIANNGTLKLSIYVTAAVNVKGSTVYERTPRKKNTLYKKSRRAPTKNA